MITHPQNRIYLLQIRRWSFDRLPFIASKAGHSTFTSFTSSCLCSANVLKCPFPPARASTAAAYVHFCRFLRFWSSPRPISNSQLHTLLHFHPCPINLVVFKGTYFLKGMGDLILEGASRLDAFSVYPFPAWLPSYGPGGPAGAPEAGPPRSSRTKGSSPQTSCAHAG